MVGTGSRRSGTHHGSTTDRAPERAETIDSQDDTHLKFELPLEDILAHSGWMHGLARSLLLDQARVDDVVQQTMLVALQRGPRQRSQLRAWLGGIIRNVVRQQVRADGRRARRETIAAARAASRASSDLLEEAELHRQVVHAVTALSEPYRTTILLRFFKGRSPEETARAMSVPASTVRTRQKRALEQLRHRLDRDFGGDRSAWSMALVPLALVGSGASGLTLASPLSTSLKGASVMTTTAKLSVGSALLLLLSTAALWWAIDRGHEHEREVTPHSVSREETARASLRPPAGRESASPMVLPDSARQQPTPLVVEREVPESAVDHTASAELPSEARELSLVVVDSEGHPLPDAFMFDPGTTKATAHEADQDGVIRWLVAAVAEGEDTTGASPTEPRAPNPASYHSVADPRHLAVLLDVSTITQWPHRVVLRPATILEVRVKSVAQSSPPDLKVTVLMPGDAFEAEHIGFDSLIHGRLRSGAGGMGHPDKGFSFWPEEDAEERGLYTVYGVTPEVELLVNAQGPSGEQLGQKRVVLKRGELRKVDFLITERSRSLSGHVTDAAGLPVAGVSIHLWPQNGLKNQHRLLRTDDEGRYSVDGLVTRFVSLMIMHDGSARYERSDLDLDASTLHDIDLQASESFTLRVVHRESGRPVHTASASMKWKTFPAERAERIEPGLWIFRDPPRGPTQVVLWHADTSLEVVRAPGQSELLMEVDETLDVTILGLRAYRPETPTASAGSTADADPGYLAATRVAGGKSLRVVAEHDAATPDVALLRELPAGTWDVAYRSNKYARELLARARFTSEIGEPLSVWLQPVEAGGDSADH